MTTPIATVSATGIAIPTYSDCYNWLISQYQTIFGADVYLGSDSQDGQLIGIFSQALADVNNALGAAYNAFSPTTAQGAGLSSVVKINGIARLVPTNSTVTMTLVGQNGTVINNGGVQDTAGNAWNLPATVNIGSSGTVNALATCTVQGAITAQAGAITQIATPTYGWQSATNAAAATPGAPAESDAMLRVRQSGSVALPSQTVLSGILGAVKAVPSVSAAVAYENDTVSTDGNGLPPHSISLVVQGGDPVAIATAISNKKTPGAYTYGSTSQVIVDSIGVAHTIRFYAPTAVRMSVGITVHALTGYTTAIGIQIRAAIAAYINALPIGQSVLLTRLYLPAQLNGGTGSGTFEVTILQISAWPASLGNSDVAIAFNQIATCAVADVALTVV